MNTIIQNFKDTLPESIFLGDASCPVSVTKSLILPLARTESNKDGSLTITDEVNQVKIDQKYTGTKCEIKFTDLSTGKEEFSVSYENGRLVSGKGKTPLDDAQLVSTRQFSCTPVLFTKQFGASRSKDHVEYVPSAAGMPSGIKQKIDNGEVPGVTTTKETKEMLGGKPGLSTGAKLGIGALAVGGAAGLGYAGKKLYDKFKKSEEEDEDVKQHSGKGGLAKDHVQRGLDVLFPPKGTKSHGAYDPLSPAPLVTHKPNKSKTVEFCSNDIKMHDAGFTFPKGAESIGFGTDSKALEDYNGKVNVVYDPELTPPAATTIKPGLSTRAKVGIGAGIAGLGAAGAYGAKKLYDKFKKNKSEDEDDVKAASASDVCQKGIDAIFKKKVKNNSAADQCQKGINVLFPPKKGVKSHSLYDILYGKGVGRRFSGEDDVDVSNIQDDLTDYTIDDEGNVIPVQYDATDEAAAIKQHSDEVIPQAGKSPYSNVNPAQPSFGNKVANAVKGVGRDVRTSAISNDLLTTKDENGNITGKVTGLGRTGKGVLIGAGIAGGTALAAHGINKLRNYLKDDDDDDETVKQHGVIDSIKNWGAQHGATKSINKGLDVIKGTKQHSYKSVYNFVK